MIAQRESRSKWILYALATLLCIILQQQVLDHIRIWGALPFLLPLLCSTLAVYEGWMRGGIYGLTLGVLTDLLLSSGPTAWFYTVAFTLIALTAAAVSKYIMSPGFLCSLLSGGVGYLLLQLLRLTLYLLLGSAQPVMLLIALKELFLSLPFVLPAHWLLVRIWRYYYHD